MFIYLAQLVEHLKFEKARHPRREESQVQVTMERLLHFNKLFIYKNNTKYSFKHISHFIFLKIKKTSITPMFF